MGTTALTILQGLCRSGGGTEIKSRSGTHLCYDNNLE